MAALDSGNSSDALREYELPAAEPLNRELDRRLGTEIQQAIDGLRDRFASRIAAFVSAAKVTTISERELAESVTTGLRAGLVKWLNGKGTIETLSSLLCDEINTEIVRFAKNGLNAVPSGSSPSELAQQTVDRDSLTKNLAFQKDDLAAIEQAELQIAELANRLITRNMRLAQAIARQYLGRSCLDLHDLFQEGALAIRKAAIHYRPAMSAAFSTFATTVIRRHLISTIRTAGGASEHQARAMRTFKKTEGNLAIQLQRRPSEEEVFELLTWSETECANVRRALHADNPSRIPQRGEEPNELSPVNPRPERSVDDHAEEQDLLLAVGRLDAQEREILTLRYCRGELSFKRIGKELGIPDHQVRRRHDAALAKLERDLNPTPKTTPSARPMGSGPISA